MRTPAEYTKNIRNKIITEDMLGACAFSVNKRAKNYRDTERRTRNIAWKDEAREKKEGFYKQKDFLLSIVSPDCIHSEEQRHKERVYDWEPDFDEISPEDTVHEGEYYDRDVHRVVEFKDRFVTSTVYYLYYQLGTYSFHRPIFEYEVSKYPELEVKDIGSLATFGKDANDLISMQFVKKVIELIRSGEYVLKSGKECA